MINHLRTLLLNDRPAIGEDFEEFVPPGFAPLPLSSAEAAVQRRMVPAHFPRRTRNLLATIGWKVAQTLPLFSEVEKIDGRQAQVDNPITTLLPVTSVNRVSGDTAVRVLGSLIPVADRGIFKRTWRLKKETDTSIEVVELPRSERTALDLTFNGDCSSMVPLLDSGLSLQVIGSTTVPTFSMTITAETPMAFDLVAVLASMRSDTAVDGVFALQDKTMGVALLQDYLHSIRPDLALGAALVAYTLHLTERLGL